MYVQIGHRVHDLSVVGVQGNVIGGRGKCILDTYSRTTLFQTFTLVMIRYALVAKELISRVPVRTYIYIVSVLNFMLLSEVLEKRMEKFQYRSKFMSCTSVLQYFISMYMIMILRTLI